MTRSPTRLPYLTSEVPPMPGEIRRHPEDFRVVERPAYDPEGRGDHLYLKIRKIDLTTPEALRRLASALEVDPKEGGFAGLKDRHAVTVQWVSLHRASPSRALSIDVPGIEVLEAIPHPTRLKTGHLRGNDFEIRIRGFERSRLADAEKVLAHLGREGVPNYFGEQRFGNEGKNLERAHAFLVEGGRPPRSRFERKMLCSTLQSELFNRRVAERVATGTLGTVFEGDLVRKEDTGGLFAAEDVAEVQDRCDRWAVSPTGPMFGAKMRWPLGEARRMEEELMRSAGVTEETLRRMGRNGRGTRRVVRVRPESMAFHSTEEGATLAMSLPKGTYATVVLRELLKDGDA